MKSKLFVVSLARRETFHAKETVTHGEQYFIVEICLHTSYGIAPYCTGFTAPIGNLPFTESAPLWAKFLGAIVNSKSFDF
jgi:hypothetical protein